MAMQLNHLAWRMDKAQAVFLCPADACLQQLVFELNGIQRLANAFGLQMATALGQHHKVHA